MRRAGALAIAVLVAACQASEDQSSDDLASAEQRDQDANLSDDHEETDAAELFDEAGSDEPQSEVDPGSQDESPDGEAASPSASATDDALEWSFGFTDGEGWTYRADVALREAEFSFDVDVASSPPGSARVAYELKVPEFQLTVQPDTPGRNPPSLPTGVAQPLFGVILELPGPSTPWQTNVNPVGPCSLGLKVSSDPDFEGFWRDVIDDDRVVMCSLIDRSSVDSSGSDGHFTVAGTSDEMSEERADAAVSLLNNATPVAYRLDVSSDTNATQGCRFALLRDGSVETPFGSVSRGHPCQLGGP